MFTDSQADTVGDAYVAVTGLPTCGTKATSESVTNIAHLALEMLGQLNNLDHENESMCEVGASDGFIVILDLRLRYKL